MTSRKNLKRLVRQRAAKTGESYSAALRHVRDQPVEETVATKASIQCSFCNKTQKEVKKLVAGPGVYICDECIALCNEIVDEGDGEDAAARPPELSRDAALLLKLPMFAQQIGNMEAKLATMVTELREMGVEWPHIGAALDVSPQDAEARFDT